MKQANLVGILATVGILTTCVSACGDAPSEPSTALVRHLIYGADDRLDVGDAIDAASVEHARNSTLALIPWSRIIERDDGAYDIEALSIGERYQLCADEAFAEQVSAAECTATLIAPDLAITAAHCVDSPEECEGTSVVFGYLLDANRQLAPLPAGNIYRCTATVFVEAHYADGDPFDVAVFRLDRPAAAGFASAPITQGTAAPTAGNALIVIGTGEGAPIKVDAGAIAGEAVGVSPSGFKLAADVFVGSSGSGVYNTAGELVGVLAQGQRDYRDDNGCNRARILTNNTPAETAFLARRAINKMCAADPGISTLCPEPPAPPVADEPDPVDDDSTPPEDDAKGDAGDSGNDQATSPVAAPTSSGDADGDDGGCTLAPGHADSTGHHVVNLFLLLVLAAAALHRRSIH